MPKFADALSEFDEYVVFAAHAAERLKKTTLRPRTISIIFFTGDYGLHRVTAVTLHMGEFKLLSNRIEDALFPVELRDVSVDSPSGAFRLKNFRAVVDIETSHVFTVVSSAYTLVTNCEAVEACKNCFDNVFGGNSNGMMVCRQVIMPSTRSFCHMDFIHQDRCFALTNFKTDLWQPYLRITNSYNRTRSLRIDLGYYRLLCSNGALTHRGGPRFKFVHNRKSGLLSRNLKVGFAKAYAEVEGDFKSSLDRLHQFEIEPKFVWPLFCKTIGIDVVASKKDLGQLVGSKDCQHEQKRILIHRLTKKYFSELGPTAYAVFNIFTDYATRPPEVAPHLQIHRLQKKCGEWINGFTRLIRDRDFRIESYLENFLSHAS